MYNELHIEFCKLAKEVLGLRKKNRKLEELFISSTSKGSQVPSIEKQLVLPIENQLSRAEASTHTENCSNCESLVKEKEKFSKDPETSKVDLKEQRLLENKIDQQDNDRKSHSEYHSIICHYCGRSGHISHTCSLRKNLHVRNKFVWISKGQVRSSTNHVGPKYKWVPKPPSSALLV